MTFIVPLFTIEFMVSAQQELQLISEVTVRSTRMDKSCLRCYMINKLRLDIYICLEHIILSRFLAPQYCAHVCVLELYIYSMCSKYVYGILSCLHYTRIHGSMMCCVSACM